MDCNNIISAPGHTTGSTEKTRVDGFTFVLRGAMESCSIGERGGLQRPATIAQACLAHLEARQTQVKIGDDLMNLQ